MKPPLKQRRRVLPPLPHHNSFCGAPGKRGCEDPHSCSLTLLPSLSSPFGFFFPHHDKVLRTICRLRRPDRSNPQKPSLPIFFPFTLPHVSMDNFFPPGATAASSRVLAHADSNEKDRHPSLSFPQFGLLLVFFLFLFALCEVCLGAPRLVLGVVSVMGESARFLLFSSPPRSPYFASTYLNLECLGLET